MTHPNEITRGAEKNILVLCPPTMYAEFFSAATDAALRQLGKVTFSTTDTPWTPDELAAAIGEIDALITATHTPELTPALLDAAPRLGFVGHVPGSVKRVVKEHVLQRGVRVSSGSAGMAPAVAEFSLGLVLLALRMTHEFDRGLRFGQHTWDGPYAFGGGREFAHERVGVIGAGLIGRQFIRKSVALGAETLVTDPYIPAEAIAALGARRVDLDDLLRSCTVIVIHAPTIPETHRMIGARELALVQDGTLIVNTARSWVTDEDALLAELQTGRIMAALDVFDTEPLPLDHPFRSLPNAILTPHIGSATIVGRHRQAAYIVRDLENWIAGRDLEFEVTLERYPYLA
jgi:phosphoglycerate dehydrogenase-like enzyme